MKDNKKKTIVVLALGLVIVCVGVFQFVIGGSPAPAAPPSEKKQDKKAQLEAAKEEPPKNPLLTMNLPARDPFAAAALPQAAKPAPQPAKPDPEPEIRHPSFPPMQIDKGGLGLGTGPLTVQALPEAKFAFTLSGVMLGAKPMAVFTDATGNQRLILLGGSLDPDSKVISIDKDTVTVRFHGKTLRLTVEGNPNAK
jgi:hypothetical protein